MLQVKDNYMATTHLTIKLVMATTHVTIKLVTETTHVTISLVVSISFLQERIWLWIRDNV